MESCPGWHRPNLILLIALYHCIHSLKIHFISNSSSHGSLFPVFLYDELCNGQACTCFMLECHCFSKVDTNIWNCWLIVRQNRERAWLLSLKCQLLHHPDSLAFQPQTSPKQSISTSTWVHNPELTARRPPWGGRSEQHAIVSLPSMCQDLACSGTTTRRNGKGHPAEFQWLPLFALYNVPSCSLWGASSGIPLPVLAPWCWSLSPNKPWFCLLLISIT